MQTSEGSNIGSSNDERRIGSSMKGPSGVQIPTASKRSRRDLALLEMVMHKHQRVAHAWHVKYERLRHATHEYKSIFPDHIGCHACGNIVDFHLAFVHARVPMSLRECYPCRMPTASKRPNSRDPSGVQIPTASKRSRRDLALLEMVMHKHQRVAHAWYVKYERLRHATHDYKSILPDHIACHASGNIVDFHLAFVHAPVPMSLRECYPCRMPTASKRPNSRDPSGVLPQNLLHKFTPARVY
jgi:hypothetical protein